MPARFGERALSRSEGREAVTAEMAGHRRYCRAIAAQCADARAVRRPALPRRLRQARRSSKSKRDRSIVPGRSERISGSCTSRSSLPRGLGDARLWATSNATSGTVWRYNESGRFTIARMSSESTLILRLSHARYDRSLTRAARKRFANVSETFRERYGGVMETSWGCCWGRLAHGDEEGDAGDAGGAGFDAEGGVRFGDAA